MARGGVLRQMGRKVKPIKASSSFSEEKGWPPANQKDFSIWVRSRGLTTPHVPDQKIFAELASR
jgi:hypothetical protein